MAARKWLAGGKASPGNSEETGEAVDMESQGNEQSIDDSIVVSHGED